ncbi:MAG: hypothetical protein ABEI07_01925, partial [Candidatus Nanohaloarchaea archaeon]
AFSFAFIYLHQLVRGVSKPVISDYLNSMVESGRRSTILSTHSLLGRVLQAIGMPFFGLVADFYTLSQTLSLMAFTAFLGGGTLLVALYLEGVLEMS